MKTAFAHSQGKVLEGILLKAPITSMMFTMICTQKIEKMEMSKLVTAKPSRSPLVSMLEGVRYLHINIK